MTFLRKPSAILQAAATLLIFCRYGHGEESPRIDPSARIGVFDSRAVAIAYYRSGEFRKLLAAKHAERDRAKAAGDEAAAARLESDGREWQELIHQQGSGARSIDNILALSKVKNELPAIAEAGNVRVVVSQGQVAYQAAAVQTVDLTDHFVKLFSPDDETLRLIRDIQKQTP